MWRGAGQRNENVKTVVQKAQPKGTHNKSKCSQSFVEEPNKAKTVCEGSRTKKV